MQGANVNLLLDLACACPWQQLIEITLFVFRQSDQDSVCLPGINLQSVTVQVQEYTGREEHDMLFPSKLGGTMSDSNRAGAISARSALWQVRGRYNALSIL